MNDAKAVRKHAAQHDLFNRIHSIASDERFVRKVAEHWYLGRYQVVANQRCGTWYCDPATTSDVYAYFKSTDGHTLNWNFNLRRSNLPLADWAERNGGFILVDSTRRGKRMPDGLSKTVPIWAACINRAIALRRGGTCTQSWDTEIYLPAIVSPSERSQIEARLDDWAEDLENSVLPLPEITKPLRPFFVHPATSRPPEIPANPPYTPIICLSASRWVNGSDGRGDVLPTATTLGDGFFSRTVAFDYVPGAGDDDELWGRGLKPSLYHEHKHSLLSTGKDQLPDAVDALVREQNLLAPFQGLDLDISDVSAKSLWGLLTKIDATLALDLGHAVASSPATHAEPSAWLTVRVIEVSKSYRGPAVVTVNTHQDFPEVIFAIPCPRAEPKAYGPTLRSLEAHIASLVSANPQLGILLAIATIGELDSATKCSCNGSTVQEAVSQARASQPVRLASKLKPAEVLEARRVIIPIAVVLLSRKNREHIDKSVIASHLHRLVALWPDGNPPRAALKRVNEYLMSEARD